MTAPATRQAPKHQELAPFGFTLPVTSGTFSQGLMQWKVRGFRLDEAVFIPSVSISASSGNYWVITLTDGTNTLATWSTATGQQGALVAGTPARMVLASSGAPEQFLAPGDTLTFVVTPTGSPAVLAGQLAVAGHLL